MFVDEHGFSSNKSEPRVVVENFVFDIVKSQNVVLFHDFVAGVVSYRTVVLPFAHRRVCVAIKLQMSVHIPEPICLRSDIDQVQNRFVFSFWS